MKLRGVRDRSADANAGIFGYVTFKKANADRLKLLLRVSNYLSAPFGTSEYELVNYGVEGAHFTKDAGGMPIPLSVTSKATTEAAADKIG